MHMRIRPVLRETRFEKAACRQATFVRCSGGPVGLSETDLELLSLAPNDRAWAHLCIA